MRQPKNLKTLKMQLNVLITAEYTLYIVCNPEFMGRKGKTKNKHTKKNQESTKEKQGCSEIH